MTRSICTCHAAASLLAAFFKGHPAQQKSSTQVVDKVGPAAAHRPDAWERFDECHDYRQPPADVHAQLKLDEKSHQGGENGDDHPLCW